MLEKRQLIGIFLFVIIFAGLGGSASLIGKSVDHFFLVRGNMQGLGDPWSLLWKQSRNDYFQAVTTSVGAVFVAGYYQEAGTPSSGNRNVLLIRFTPEGEPLWNQSWDSSSDEAAFSLKASTDALYLAGLTTSAVNGSDGLLAKIDFNGNHLWNSSWGGPGNEWFTGVSIGIDGIYASGIIRNSVNAADALIVKFTFDGVPIWNESWHMANVNRGSDIAATTDSVYLVGDYGTLWNGTSNNAFVVKYSPTGIQMWNRTWGGPQNDIGRAVAEFNESIYVTGSTESQSSSSTAELFLIQYNSSGHLLWTQMDEMGDNHSGYAVRAINNEVYVGGEFEGAPNGWRSSILRFNDTGEIVWRRQWGGAGNCRPTALTTSFDSIFFTGITSGWLTDTTNGFLVKFGLDGTSAPGPIDILGFSDVDPFGSFTVSWTEGIDPDGIIAGYELQMDTSPTFDWPNIVWNTNETNQFVPSRPEGTYYFRVRARDNNDIYGPWSSIHVLNVTITSPLPFNPWLAPTILVLGILIMIAIILFLFIRRWRFE